MSKYFFVIEMSYLIYFFQMIKEQDWIIFYVIVIKIFDHFPDQTYTYTMLIKVPKKLEFPGLSVDGK